LGPFIKPLPSLVLAAIVLLTSCGDGASGAAIPAMLNGRPVVFVETSENTAGLPPGRAVLVVQDGDSDTIAESIEKNSWPSVLERRPLPVGRSILIVSRDVARNALEQFHRDNFESHNAAEQMRRESAQRPVAAYAYSSNTDPITESVDYQSATWYAPTVGNKQDRHSAFVVSAFTDANDYFLQVGNYYVNGRGRIAYSSTGLGFAFIDFPMPYIPGHLYHHFILYSGTPGYWYLGVVDLTDYSFQYYVQSGVAGTKLKADNNTGVVFTNFNTNPDWHSGFPQSITAHGAETRASGGQYRCWRGDSTKIYDASGNEAPNEVIFGQLSACNEARWLLASMPLGR
jgi:hypothetical protein